MLIFSEKFRTCTQGASAVQLSEANLQVKFPDDEESPAAPEKSPIDSKKVFLFKFIFGNWKGECGLF
jgi:hypothetical protein